jgi:hypothetical protein
MKTVKIATAVAAVAVALAASAASANTHFRNVDSLITASQGGGQIIVALDIKCSYGGGNFVMQTNGNAREMYRGCAFREGDRVLIRWNDGQVVSYAPSVFYRTTAWLDV